MKVFIFVFVLFMPTVLVADYMLRTINDGNHFYSIYRKEKGIKKDYYIIRHSDNFRWHLIDPDYPPPNLAKLCGRPRTSCLTYDHFLNQICPVKKQEGKGLHFLCSFLKDILYDNNPRPLHELAPTLRIKPVKHPPQEAY